MIVLMSKNLTVSVCKIVKLGVIKDGKMGVSIARANRIKLARYYTRLNNI